MVKVAEHVSGIHPRFAAEPDDFGPEDADEEHRAHFENRPERDVDRAEADEQAVGFRQDERLVHDFRQEIRERQAHVAVPHVAIVDTESFDRVEEDVACG